MDVSLHAGEAMLKPVIPLGFLARQAITYMSDAYGLALLGILALRLLSGDRLWPIVFLANFLHLLLLPSLILFVRAILLGLWHSAGLQSVSVLAFLVLFGGLFLPRLPADTGCPSCGSLRVMTYNIAAGLAEPERLVESVRESGADIVALQEVSDVYPPILQQRLGDVYPYQVHYPQSVFGKSLLSRYPILDEERFIIPEAGAYPPHLQAIIDVDGQPLTFFNAHPLRPQFRAGRYVILNDLTIAELARRAASRQGATIMVGDFNTTDQMTAYHTLRQAGLIDSFREAGFGFGLTYPNFRAPAPEYPYVLPPLVRLDYVWHTQDMTALRFHRGRDAHSDHLPLIVDLIWRVQE